MATPQRIALVLPLAGFLCAPALYADLDPVAIWNGNVGISIDAIGSNNTPVGNIQAEIPTGATILAAYLYSAGTPFPWYADSPQTLADYNGSGITLAGSPVDNFSELVGATALPNRPDLGDFFTGRADVTSIIQALATTGPNYSWSISEGLLNQRIDGDVLAIIYEHASLPEGSVVLLDGGQTTGGETTTVNFAAPLGDVTDPGFFADMSLAISFSTGNSQHSIVNVVNGTRLSTSAGGFDDGGSFDGGLITAGGVGDSNANPADAFSTSSLLDDEFYSLNPFLSTGAMGFNIFTQNPSDDDNIFMMALHISGDVGSVNQPVIPEANSMLAVAGLAAAGFWSYRRRRA